MTEPTKRDCYDCTYYNLCRIRDKASNFLDYVNTTGNYLTDSFRLQLYALIGSSCTEYTEPGVVPKNKERKGSKE